MDKIIGLFFYEGINRIIPGLVFIGFYYNQEIEKALNKFQNWNFFVVASILLAAWLIGFMLNAAVWSSYRLIVECLPMKRLNKFKETNGSKYPRICCIISKLTCEASREKDVSDEKEHVRLKRVKEQAEKVMCHVLLLVFIITLFRPPNGLFKSEWHNHYYSLYGILGFGLITILIFINDCKGFK
jgi:hypothetical protein